MAHFCKNCGLLTAPYDERCPKCGAPLPHIPMGEALLESMRQSPEGTVETGEPLYEQDLEEDRIDAMSQPPAGRVLRAAKAPHHRQHEPGDGDGEQQHGRRRRALAHGVDAVLLQVLLVGGWPGRTWSVRWSWRGWSSCLWLWPRWCLPPRCTASWPTTITVEEAP